ncbi:elongator complex protein 2-like isoform X2 [Dendronephthya gigantea]|uniref:elongator complex protein 2-like isoform X2 n=1 Tax=Dendronephthya gigantea TaxID=151771 RepID=UPI001069813F|nr:elongator complex protein 2-like isoform X2 [Dendronephthya gigantea]
MADSRVQEKYISVGCNRNPYSLDWGSNGLVAFGASKSIALYLPEDEQDAGRIKCLLNGHRERVNCVKWISKENLGNESELISGAIDGQVIIWGLVDGKWDQCDTLSGHSGAIIAVTGICVQSRTVVATSSADSSVKIWNRNGKVFEFIEALNFDGEFTFSIFLSNLPGTKIPILACGCENATVYLFTEKDSKFILAQKLLGHEDWIRDVKLAHLDNGDVMLASCSQDNFIRVWCISKVIDRSGESREIDDIMKLKLTSNKFSITSEDVSLDYSAVLETILSGHEGWVYSLSWHPKIRQGNHYHQPLCLMSSSMDKTIVIWRFDSEAGVWMDDVRVGEVGGNTLGFYGGVFNPTGEKILAHSYQGSLQMWQKNKSTESSTWKAVSTVSGHYAPVQDIAWDPEGGEFLVSLSSDQTTRIHAPWRRTGHTTTWHEIARPQVHGHNMQCLTMISRYCFVSGADEKVIRIFEAPKGFVDMLSSLSKINSNEVDCQPLGASVPVLGLSNKAVFDDDLKNLKDDLNDPQRPMKASAFASEEPPPFSPFVVNEPPTENNLMQSTLWPETQKLYGHGYEIFCMAYEAHSHLLASACKASKAVHANILLWDVLSWKQVGSLHGHSLTVTQMEFSHSGRYLLSVSRDRTWCLFERAKEDDESLFRLKAKYNKKSKVISRVIWSCSWTVDDRYFITASRDKKVVIWGQDEKKESWAQVGTLLDAGEAVTAVAASLSTSFFPSYLVALGTESGDIRLYEWSLESGWKNCIEEDKKILHTGTVTRIRWRPGYTDTLFLASSSTDNCVRIFEVKLPGKIPN